MDRAGRCRVPTLAFVLVAPDHVILDFSFAVKNAVVAFVAVTHQVLCFIYDCCIMQLFYGLLFLFVCLFVFFFLKKTQVVGPPTATAPTAPMIVALSPSDAKYVSILNQMKQSWGQGAFPRIQTIYAVMSGTAVYKRFVAYQAAILQKRPHLKPHGKGGPGNTQRRFHGTALACDLKGGQMCSNAACGVCGIIQKGFLISYSQSNLSKGLFGSGLYFASDPSKSAQFSKPFNGLQAMLLVKVVLGDGEKMAGNEPGCTHLKKAPHGKDSVLGEPGPVLNRDECVVYADDAALPSYLIIFS